MCIISTNSTSNINSFLARCGFSGYFQSVYGSIGLLNKTSALKKILKKNSLKAVDAVYVGDEVRDIEAAKKVNVPVVSVTWGFNESDRLVKEGPMVVVRTRPELLKVLESWEVS
jgi:phosphoglycolate phosphatase-like HAD superfamily hydrolase